LLGLCFLLKSHVFALNEQLIYTFTGGADGMYPTGLISDAAGNLYGGTEATRNWGPGTIFELVKNGSSYTYTVLYSFAGRADGLSASGPLALDGHGEFVRNDRNGRRLPQGKRI